VALVNIRPLAFVDTSSMAATMLTRHKKDFTASAREGVHTLPLAPELLKDWRSASSLLTRIRSGSAPFLGGKPAVIDRATLVMLMPGAHIPWAVETDDYAAAHNRLHLCLVQVPGATVYSGGDAAALLVGQVTWVNHRVLNSEANFGSYPSYKLVLDIEHDPVGTPMGAA
jgi:hypothetical protein